MASKFTVQLLETTAALITAAFGLVAALAWNEAIKTYIAKVFADTGMDQVGGLITYAVIVTVIAVVATMLIAWALAKAKGEGKEEKA